MLHWLNIELWAPMWPNLASSAATFIPGFLWAHRKMLHEAEKREAAHRRRHRELLQAVQDAASPGLGHEDT